MLLKTKVNMLDLQKINQIVKAFEDRGLTRNCLEAAIDKKLEELSEDQLIELRQVYKIFLQGKPILEAVVPFFGAVKDDPQFDNMF